MTKKKLKKLRDEIRSLHDRSGSICERDLVGIARKLGLYRAKRGSEPTYVSADFPEKRPIRIPSHPGALKRGTALGILGDLEGYLCSWKERLSKSPQTKNDHGKEP